MKASKAFLDLGERELARNLIRKAERERRKGNDKAAALFAEQARTVMRRSREQAKYREG